jgi:hypothetical protein
MSDLNYPEEVVVAELEPAVGRVIGDVADMTMEEFHTISMAPDFGTNKVLQEIVRKWKLAHLPQE